MKPLTRRQRPSTTQAKTGSRTNYQVSISQVCAFTAGIAIYTIIVVFPQVCAFTDFMYCVF